MSDRDYKFRVAGFRAEGGKVTPDRLTLRLDAGDDGIVPVPIDLQNQFTMTAGWAMVVLGALSCAEDKQSVSSIEAQNEMAHAFNSVHMALQKSHPAMVSHMSGAVAHMLRSMAKTCEQMAAEIDNHGSTEFWEPKP